MLPKPEIDFANIVDLGSSDDEDGVGIEKGTHTALVDQTLHTGVEIEVQTSVATPPSSYSDQNQIYESRSFWKAGSYDVVPSRSAPAQGQLEHARVHPKFLHSNATSHKWAFGAIAELLDNAVDEICNGATFVKVDKIYNMKDNTPALLFQDNGGGMDPESMRKCMSLGYSSKKANTTIGQYLGMECFACLSISSLHDPLDLEDKKSSFFFPDGNGFKTSTMRLGADVIVFSRASRASHTTQSIGLLSYTFLRRTGQDDVIVPMVDFELSERCAEPILNSSQDDWASNLKIILGWSPFASKEELMLQFDDIGPHGTKIIIFNLWHNDDGMLELNFDEDDEDIRLRDEANYGSTSKVPNRLVKSHISYRIRYSLRAYASILYLRKFTNFDIILRGKPVQQFNIADELKFPKVVMYRPQLGMASKEVSVETTIGFVKEAPLQVSGFNVYHKNRLIRPFWKVTSEGSSRGNGVVGVLEANFIEPAHDKQDFERSSLFIRLEGKLKQIILDYWNVHCHLIGLVPPGASRSLRKECPDQPPVRLDANLQKEVPADQHVIGLSANLQREMHLDPPVIGLAASLRQELSNAQPGTGFTSNFQKEMSTVQPIIGLTAGSSKEPASVDGSGSISVDQICEENIQLFMRCEEHIQRENDLKLTIEELERELEEARRKCAQLSSHLEIQKKQKLMKQQTEKV